MLKNIVISGNILEQDYSYSGFTTSSYIRTSEALPMGSNTVDIYLHLEVASLNGTDTIIGNAEDAINSGGFVLRTASNVNRLCMWGSNGSSWSPMNFDTGIDLSIGTNFIHIQYKNNTFRVGKSSSKDVEYTYGNTVSCNLVNFVNYVKFGLSGSQSPFEGLTLVSKDSYIRLNGEYWNSYEYTGGPKTKIVQRHDTAVNWTAVNPVLAAGEMGVETDTNKFKFGDGVTAWADLAYAAGEGGSSGTTLTSTDGITTYSKLALGDTLAVTDTSTKELNKLTQTGGTLNSELEFTGASGASLKMTEKYSLSTADSWEFQIKYKHNGGGPNPCVFGYASGSDYKTPAFILEGGSFKFFLSSNGGSWNLNQANSGLVPQAGTIYYFKVGFTGSQYYIKYNTTGWSDEFTTQWTLNSTTKVYCSDYFMLMNLSLNTGYYNTGTMYLQDTALIINGTEVWRGAKVTPGDIILDANAYTKTETDSLLTAKQDKLVAEAPLKIHVDDKAVYRVTAINGEINTTDNTFTGTETGYLLAKKQDLGFTLADYDTWEFRTKISFATNSTTGEQSIFSTNTLSTAFNIYGNSQMKWYLSSNGSDWNIALYGDTTHFETKSIYYIRLRFTGTQYIMERSTTGFDSMSTIASNSTSTKIYPIPVTNLELIKAKPAYSSSIYLEDTCFIGNGKVIWKAYDESKIGENIITTASATTSSLGVVQPDGTSITVSEAGVISGQDVKTFTGYSDTGTLVLKSINGVLQWVAEA